jgi:hypothetical protein
MSRYASFQWRAVLLPIPARDAKTCAKTNPAQASAWIGEEARAAAQRIT